MDMYDTYTHMHAQQTAVISPGSCQRKRWEDLSESLFNTDVKELVARRPDGTRGMKPVFDRDVRLAVGLIGGKTSPQFNPADTTLHHH